MKPLSPHDPLDDLIAAALHGDLTPEERTQFESRLSNDPAARAAYQEAQAMHDLLEKTHQSAQPDSAFEQRMVSGVRRKLQSEQHRETAWESVLVLWRALNSIFGRRSVWAYGGVCSLMLVLGLAFAIYRGNQVKSVFTTITSQLAVADEAEIMAAKAPQAPLGFAHPSSAQLAHLDKLAEHYQAQLRDNPSNQMAARQLAHVEEQKQRFAADADAKSTRDASFTDQFAGGGLAINSAHSLNKGSIYLGGTTISGGNTVTAGATEVKAGRGGSDANGSPVAFNAPTAATSPQGGTIHAMPFTAALPAATPPPPTAPTAEPNTGLPSLNQNLASNWNEQEKKPADAPSMNRSGFASDGTPTVVTQSGEQKVVEAIRVFPYPGTDKTAAQAATASEPAADTAPADNRKLVRNAQLDLEVKSFQETTDKITQFTKAAGGYVDTSHSEKGGNGKLQGTVVVKVLPQNLDAFLLKLRDLGQVNNQSVSTDDVTKDYYDTQARLENSRRMETQLQDLLKRENGKVSDLLAVERELGRVRGEIEQMQGQLKLYDFQVQYATVTMNISEKDLNQTAAYLLKEQDDFSLFATDVEGTFQNSRKAAEDFKAQVLVANLNHNSGSDVTALLVVSVPPDQIEPFLAQVRSLGRVANFTRQTQRVAKDGGDSNQPADQTLTEKDKIMVNVSIHSDDESRKQVALTVVAKAVDTALDQAKAAALANAGVEILSSSLNKTPQGESTAQLSVRVPGKEYSTLIDAFNALGRPASLSIQRNDNSGPGANGDDAPVIVSLSLTDNDTPLQETEMSVLATDVDAQAQQIKKDAAAAGVEVKASSFERQPDGMEFAQMVFRMPMAKYTDFLGSVEKLGKVESLSVRRDDRPDQAMTDGTAPVEISLQLHNERGIVADNGGLWATLRQTFGEGANALFGSIRVIGVCVAFLAPWVFTLLLLAWIGRRIYVWKKK